MSLKFCRLVGLSCGSVCLIQLSEAIRDSFSTLFLHIYRMILPSIVRHTVGVVAVGARRYIDWLGALHRSVVVLGWPLLLLLASLTSIPISSDILPSLLGLPQYGSRGTHSSTAGRIKMRPLKVKTSPISLESSFLAYIFALLFCCLRSFQFSG